MTGRLHAAGVLAVAGFLVCAASANADDIIRLKMTPGDNAPTMNLRGGDEDAAVVDVGFRGGARVGVAVGPRGGVAVGVRGGVGFRGGVAFVGGYRPYYGGGYGFVYNSPYYYGPGAYSPYTYGNYLPYYDVAPVYSQPSYYYAPSYSYSSSYYAPAYNYAPSVYYWPPAYPTSNLTAVTPSSNLRMTASTPQIAMPYAQDDLPSNFPYNGGPQLPLPLPLPKIEPDGAGTLKTLPIATDRPVSLPASGKKFAYPAYGDKPSQTDSSNLKTGVVKQTAQ